MTFSLGQLTYAASSNAQHQRIMVALLCWIVYMLAYLESCKSSLLMGNIQDWNNHTSSLSIILLMSDCGLQVGESGWSAAIPLESTTTISQAQDFNTKPVLLRARVQEWGVIYEVVARLELVGGGFERTMVRLLRGNQDLQ